MFPIILNFNIKKLLYILAIVCSLLFVSCEEDITLDFDKNIPRLVIEGNLFVGETDYNKIHLSTTTDFYSGVFPTVNNAEVSIKDNDSNTIYQFASIGNGDFANELFQPEIDGNYELTVVYNNETYTAATTLLSSPEILDVDQKDDGGFGGDSYEIAFNFQDDANQENYYLVQMVYPVDDYLGVTDDQFTNGNIMNDLYIFDKEDLKPGDTLNHSLTSISKQYYQYLSKLLSISGDSGNPFSSPMGSIKGNIVNQTNQSNFALGYFHIAKRNHYTYTVK